MDANRKSIASLRVIGFELFIGSSPREKEALVPTNPSQSLKYLLTIDKILKPGPDIGNL